MRIDGAAHSNSVSCRLAHIASSRPIGTQTDWAQARTWPQSRHDPKRGEQPLGAFGQFDHLVARRQRGQCELRRVPTRAVGVVAHSGGDGHRERLSGAIEQPRGQRIGGGRRDLDADLLASPEPQIGGWHILAPARQPTPDEECAGRLAAVENYRRYLAIGGPYAPDARAGLTRLNWVPGARE
jgi:hypothetical protein